MEKQSLIKEICPTTTQEWIKNGALLVDIREQEEADSLSYDVPNIIHIPLSEFDKRYQEISKDADTVVVGSDPLKSLRAAGFLANHGYTKVVNMKYGIEKWVQKGFPFTGDRSLASADTACCSSGNCC